MSSNLKFLLPEEYYTWTQIKCMAPSSINNKSSVAKCRWCIHYFYPQKLYSSQRLGLFHVAEVAEALFGLILAHVQQQPIVKLPSSLPHVPLSRCRCYLTKIMVRLECSNKKWIVYTSCETDRILLISRTCMRKVPVFMWFLLFFSPTTIRQQTGNWALSPHVCQQASQHEFTDYSTDGTAGPFGRADASSDVSSEWSPTLGDPLQQWRPHTWRYSRRRMAWTGSWSQTTI